LKVQCHLERWISKLQAQMGEVLQQTKELVQQLLQSDHAMQYTMMQAIIPTLVVC
jgi:hypothetical protein